MNCVAACFGAMVLVGCVQRTLPNARVVETEGTISAAAAIGAAKNARASEHLELAKKELDRAKQLARDGNAREARIVLQGAQADAELGLMLVRASKARNEVQEVAAEPQVSSNAP
jgi:hypothetical protein